METNPNYNFYKFIDKADLINFIGGELGLGENNPLSVIDSQDDYVMLGSKGYGEDPNGRLLAIFDQLNCTVKTTEFENENSQNLNIHFYKWLLDRKQPELDDISMLIFTRYIVRRNKLVKANNEEGLKKLDEEETYIFRKPIQAYVDGLIEEHLTLEGANPFLQVFKRTDK